MCYLSTQDQERLGIIHPGEKTITSTGRRRFNPPGLPKNGPCFKGQPLTHVQLAKLLLECDATTVTLLFELLRRAMDDPHGMGQLLDKAEDVPQIRAILDPAPSDELDSDEEEQ